MNIFRATKAENIECENQAKFVQERILATEEKLATLCSTFGNYLQKTCRLRDASDDLALAVFKYGSEETINWTLKLNLVKFAECMASVGDLRETNIKLIEQDVVKPFLLYNTLCRNAKNEVRCMFSAKEHELSRRRQLAKARQKDPHNRKMITKAEIELSKAAAESSQVQRALEEHIGIFERKKILDVKRVLIGFVTTELRFLADAIGIYTEAYRNLMEINVEEDFQAFNEILKQSPNISRLEIVKKNMELTNNTISPSSQQSYSSENSTQNKSTDNNAHNSEKISSQEEVEEESEEYSSEESLDESETKSDSSQPNN